MSQRVMVNAANLSRSFKQSLIQLVDAETTRLLLIFAAILYISVLVTKKIKRNRKNYPPGPMALPYFGNLPFLGEEPHKTMAELGKTYGNIFRLYMGTKYTVVLNDYESMKEGLSHPAALDRPPHLFDHIYGGVGFGALNGALWQEQRLFSMQAMKDLGLGKGSWEELVHQEIACLMEELQASNGNAIDIGPLLSVSVSNNVISLLIGQRLQKQNGNDIVKLFHDFLAVSFEFMGPSDPASLVPGFRKFLKIFKLRGYDQVLTVTRKANAFIKGEIGKHKASNEKIEIQNFIDRYLDELETASDSKSRHHLAFSEPMLEGNLNNLFLGGSGTVYNSMCFMVRLIAAYPDVQKKIQEELDSVIGRDRKARFEDRTVTPYTFASIMEMERWASVVPLTTTRLVREDFELGGYTIPKGAEIFGNTWAIHNDTRYWKQPEKYLPERFLSEDGSKILKLPSYVPFSVGKRNCPGKPVAYMEMYLYLTSILQKFNISVPVGEKINFKIINGLVVQLYPQNLHFTLREP